VSCRIHLAFASIIWHLTTSISCHILNCHAHSAVISNCHIQLSHPPAVNAISSDSAVPSISLHIRQMSHTSVTVYQIFYQRLYWSVFISIGSRIHQEPHAAISFHIHQLSFPSGISSVSCYLHELPHPSAVTFMNCHIISCHIHELPHPLPLTFMSCHIHYLSHSWAVTSISSPLLSWAISWLLAWASHAMSCFK